MDQLRAMKRFYEAGHARKEVAEKFNVPYGSVYKFLKRVGTKFQAGATWNRNDKYKDARKLYESGMSINQLCRHYNYTDSGAIWRILTSRGTKMRPQARRGKDSNLFRGGEKAEMRAIAKANYEISMGRLIPQPCEVCGFFGSVKGGRRGVLAHHSDYSKPLSVNWLCHKHHQEWHRNNVAIASASKKVN